MKNRWQLVLLLCVAAALAVTLTAQAVMLCVACLEVTIPGEIGGGTCFTCVADTGDASYCFDGDSCGATCAEVGTGSCTP